MLAAVWEVALANALKELEDGARRRVLSIRGGRVCFSHNDYLGLSGHPTVVAAGKKALDEHACGARGSRLLGGNSAEVEAVEAAIADFFQSPDALLFNSGYQANLGLVQALAPLADAVVSDAFIHASSVDGIRLSRLEKTVLPHQSWSQWTPGGPKRWLLVAESLYSMDGDFVDVEGLMGAWEKSRGFLVLDEAHAVGVFGAGGRGVSSAWRDWTRMAVVVTFGKAFGVAGGAVLCSAHLKQWLVNKARSFIYSTALPPVVPAMVSASLGVVKEHGCELRQALWERSAQVRRIFVEGGLPVPSVDGPLGAFSPIIPLYIPGNDRALRFCQTMRDSGWELRAIRYPTVPSGMERVRITVNLAASQAQTYSMAREVVRQWKAFL